MVKIFFMPLSSSPLWSNVILMQYFKKTIYSYLSLKKHYIYLLYLDKLNTRILHHFQPT